MKSTIERFYHAFSDLQPEVMASCYDEAVRFEDPAFGALEGVHAANMWRMLCKAQEGKDFKVVFSGVDFGGDTGKARWEAYYTFAPTGRKVHNIIDANFKFRNGKIIEHIDTFDLYRWSKQALGIPGHLFGWTDFFKRKLNARTNKLLAEFEKARETR